MYFCSKLDLIETTVVLLLSMLHLTQSYVKMQPYFLGRARNCISRASLSVLSTNQIKIEQSSNTVIQERRVFNDFPITIVKTKEEARSAVQILRRHKNAIWACDTEVANINVKDQSPVGNGNVICVSIYGGDHIDFGMGSTLWVENAGDASGTLSVFKEWFEDEATKKVWHNYGFDRHVMMNEGIDCKGFAGDTMHMARLWDSSRDKAANGGDGYSLASLTSHFFYSDSRFVKMSMKDLFGRAKTKKDGTDSKVKELPDLLDLQFNPETRSEWIRYSARDALATWKVMRELERLLKSMPWVVNGNALGNMWDYYSKYLRIFGELLTDMERVGIKVDTKTHLKEAEEKARIERDRMENIFLEWAADYTPEAHLINIASTAQIQQLLFGQYENYVLISRERTFKIDKAPEKLEREQSELLRKNRYALESAIELKRLLKGRGLASTGSKMELAERLINYDEKLNLLLQESFDVLLEKCMARGLRLKEEENQLSLAEKYLSSEYQLQKKIARKKDRANGTDDTAHLVPTAATKLDNHAPSPSSSLKKYHELTISTIGLTPKVFTPSGMPQVSASLLKKLAGKDVFGSEAKWGDAFQAFGGGESGIRACRAFGALAAVGQIDATINNFLVPLQALVDRNSRIHCSLNLNTETGRLSSRKPNLQNQPALEKDQYKIRDAFMAEEDNTLIVADYGQLELRVLAHITGCRSMIDAFSKGGCFHSRTAMGMFDYIKEAVESGKVLLEWDYSKGQPNVPLVKDTYASERRKAKTLNFSIAYGKTVHGLAQDWAISKEEAQEILDAWYRDRPEVKKWQLETQQLAKTEGYVRTIMGRYRKLPDAGSMGLEAGHALRAAINTPIQGSAADIVMMAMIKLWSSDKLKSLGWRLLLQIHDEVILEGPKENREEAMKEVLYCMENPFDGVGLPPLLVHLDVDAKSADSWYKAK